MAMTTQGHRKVQGGHETQGQNCQPPMPLFSTRDIFSTWQFFYILFDSIPLFHLCSSRMSETWPFSPPSPSSPHGFRSWLAFHLQISLFPTI